MATTTLTDLPRSSVLDHKAMSAIRGAAGGGDWCLYAFSPYQRQTAPVSPIAIYETNGIADPANLQIQNIDARNSGFGMINPMSNFDRAELRAAP